jgi:molecular chaperone GrpE
LEVYVSGKEEKEDIVDETMDAKEDLSGGEDNQSVEEAAEQTTEGDAAGIEQQLADAKEEAADLKDRMLRLAADYENYKKRNERERATAMKYAGEQIFREFLPVVDNLERAVSHSGVEGNDVTAKLAGLLEGVELTLKGLHSSLEKFEVKPIESIGQPFDPNKQEALTMEPSDTIPVNHVVNEFEKGYFYKDRLLRAAKVTVSSGKAES